MFPRIRVINPPYQRYCSNIFFVGRPRALPVLDQTEQRVLLRGVLRVLLHRHYMQIIQRVVLDGAPWFLRYLTQDRAWHGGDQICRGLFICHALRFSSEVGYVEFAYWCVDIRMSATWRCLKPTEKMITGKPIGGQSCVISPLIVLTESAQEQ